MECGAERSEPGEYSVLPKSLSASAMKTLRSCPSRYFAENVYRAANFQGTAAALGTTLHAALEAFIVGHKIRRDRDVGWKIEVLLDLFTKAFKEHFGPNIDCSEYKDGKQILINWFHRPSTFEQLVGSQVLSVETKKNFPIRVVKDGQRIEIPFNYIFDRLDKIGDGEYRVVDYKSSKYALSSDDLRDNIQARAYAVAVATQFKDAKRIWVVFDFLRHESIGTVFTREDNVTTYRMLQEEAQKLVDFDEVNEKPQERLNSECLFCVRKAGCDTLISNMAVDGIMSLEIGDVAEKLYLAKSKLSGLKSLVNDLEKRVIMHAAEVMDDQIDTEKVRVSISSGSRRRVDQEKAAKILGTEIMSQYGNEIRVSDLDSIFNHPDLTAGQKAAMKGAVSRVPGNPMVKVSQK